MAKSYSIDLRARTVALVEDGESSLPCASFGSAIVWHELG